VSIPPIVGKKKKKKFGLLKLKIEYLRECEFIFETALAHESGGPWVLIDEKTEGRKSRDTVPLIYVYTIKKNYYVNDPGSSDPQQWWYVHSLHTPVTTQLDIRNECTPQTINLI
jgi:hypothetical protein